MVGYPQDIFIIRAATQLSEGMIMGIHFTRYGDGVNGGEIVFGVDKFGYSYTDDIFPSDAANDFDNIILEHGDVYNLIRQTTSNDGMGHVTEVSETSYRIYGMFQDITIKDRQIHEMGLAVSGNRKFYMKPSYQEVSGGVATTYEIKEGDIITDSHLYTGAGNTGAFRVVKILNQWWQPDQEVYRIAIVQSINLDGS